MQMSTYCPKCKKPFKYDDDQVIVYAQCPRCWSYGIRGRRDGRRGWVWQWKFHSLPNTACTPTNGGLAQPESESTLPAIRG